MLSGFISMEVEVGEDSLSFEDYENDGGKSFASYTATENIY